MQRGKEKRPTQEEIERKISDVKAIWGIEGMDVDPDTEQSLRKYFAGEISEDDLMSEVIVNYKKDKT